MVCSAEAQLLGSKAYVGIGYARQLFDFIFHFGSTVSTAKVLQNIYTLNFIGIRHTAGAISQAFAAYIAVFLMRMADFTIAVSRMTGNVMSVRMSMFVLVAVVMSAATCVTVCVSMFLLVLMVVSATAFVSVCVSVFMVVIMAATALVTMRVSVFMLMVVSATAFVTVCVSMFFMLMATAAVITMRMSVFFMFMLMAMVMAATASITMSMLRHMSHSVVIMVLAAVTAGAAFRMLAVIFYAIDMTADVSVCSYIVSTITDIL